ncbi:MAG: cellulase family glycosylhydrolase [Cytophagales bacterium]
MKKISLILAFVCLFVSCKEQTKTTDIQNSDSTKVAFIKTNGTRFELNGKPYRYIGANFWAGMNLGSLAKSGNRELLLRELDRMQKCGITNLRIMALTEGPDTEPFRIAPSNNDKGTLKEEYLVGLDFLLSEMGKRNMYAVVCMNNFWPWSGGMIQYLRWNNVVDTIKYPMDSKNTAPDKWDVYQKETAKFYSSKESMDMYIKAIDQIIKRKNSISGKLYTNDPAIMSWELCNEPRGVNNVEKYLKWIDETSTHIRSLDSNHLITIGSEGITGSPESSGIEFEKAHSFKNIDYTCAHIWIQNWGWYDPKKHKETFPSASKKALDYLKYHAEISKRINKPYVLEEFGIMKDNGNYDFKGTNVHRDEYYALMFDKVYQYAKSDSAAGAAFWAWGGEGRAREVGCWWKEGDDFLGDPPHEEQGWYSVYDTDTTTHKVIKKYADLLNSIK